MQFCMVSITKYYWQKRLEKPPFTTSRIIFLHEHVCLQQWAEEADRSDGEGEFLHGIPVSLKDDVPLKVRWNVFLQKLNSVFKPLEYVSYHI